MDARIAARAAKLLRLLKKGQRERTPDGWTGRVNTNLYLAGEGPIEPAQPQTQTQTQTPASDGQSGEQDWHFSGKTHPRGRTAAEKNGFGDVEEEGDSEQQRQRPFFLAVGFHLPHEPYLFPEKSWEAYEGVPMPLLRGE